MLSLEGIALNSLKGTFFFSLALMYCKNVQPIQNLLPEYYLGVITSIGVRRKTMRIEVSWLVSSPVSFIFLCYEMHKLKICTSWHFLGMSTCFILNIELASRLASRLASDQWLKKYALNNNKPQSWNWISCLIFLFEFF